MADVAIYKIRPVERCFSRYEGHALDICARPAYWQRSSGSDEIVEHFCEMHFRIGDTPIDRYGVFRRVQVIAEILLSGAALERSQAHSEAILSLDKAVRAMGGVLNLHTVTSTLGRVRAPTVQRELSDE